MKRLLFACFLMLAFLQLECNKLTPSEALHGDCCREAEQTVSE